MPRVDFRELRSMISMEQILDLLNFVPTIVKNEQVRGDCPVHGSSGFERRSFSANLRKNTFRCFKCQAQGNQLDLWGAATKQSLYDAAIDLCKKFSIDIRRLDR